VLAVDHPLITLDLLSWLGSFPATEEALIPLVQGAPQVLLARYPRSFLPAIEECLRQGKRGPRALLDVAPVHFLDEELVRTIDPDLRSFLNVNTPEDLAHAGLERT
jgi:molybdenum cofactor guanylyltransferase